MSDEELIRTLEREREALDRRGQAERAAEARRVSGALRQAVWKHQVALDEALRSDALADLAGESPEDVTPFTAAQATVRDLWTLVTEMRERARRFLETL